MPLRMICFEPNFTVAVWLALGSRPLVMGFAYSLLNCVGRVGDVTDQHTWRVIVTDQASTQASQQITLLSGPSAPGSVRVEWISRTPTYTNPIAAMTRIAASA